MITQTKHTPVLRWLDDVERAAKFHGHSPERRLMEVIGLVSIFRKSEMVGEGGSTHQIQPDCQQIIAQRNELLEACKAALESLVNRPVLPGSCTHNAIESLRRAIHRATAEGKEI